MRIEVGRWAGFCRGVKAAVDGAFECARQRGAEVFTDGELIHNTQTLQLLERHDVTTLLGDSDLERARGKTVIVRAHGVSPERLRQLRAVAGEVRNLTCRDVGRVQGIIRRSSNRGRSVVIFGKLDHPEVRGLLGFARDGHVVSTVEDVAALPSLGPLLLVSQTTMSREGFAEIVEAVRARFQDVEVINTICDATERRQREVRELAERNECVVVIGGAHSSNTRRLFEIAQSLGPAHLVSGVEDSRRLDLSGYRRVGVTAGASTPDWLIEEIVEELRRAGQSRSRRWLDNLLLFGLYSNLVIAGGAFLLAYQVADNIGVPFSPPLALITALYYLAMSMLNSYTNRASLEIDGARRLAFLRRYPLAFAVLLTGSTALCLVLALREGAAITALTVFSLLLGIAYNLSYLSRPGERERVLFVRTRSLLALKVFVICFAVTILLNGLPVLQALRPAGRGVAAQAWVLKGLGLYFSLCFVWVVMFTRQALVEMKTAQTDRIAGVSSLLNLLTRRQILALLLILPALLLAAMLGGVVAGHYPAYKLKYFFAVGYNCLLVIVARSRWVLRSRFVLELLVDSNLYVAGIVAWL